MHKSLKTCVKFLTVFVFSLKITINVNFVCSD